MTRREAQVLGWLALEDRPLSALLAMSCDEFSAWVRAHGGRMADIDAAARLRNAVQYAMSDRIFRSGARNVLQFRRRGHA